MIYGVRPLVLLFALTVLTAGGSILYLSYVAHTAGTPIAAEFPAPETSVAINNATLTENLVAGHGFSLATTAPYTPDSWRTPGYPLFVYPFLALTGSFYPVLIAQILTLFLTVILIFKMAERLLGTKWATALCALYLFLPDTMLSASALLNENLFLLFFMAAFYLLFFSDVKNIYFKFALTGALFAIATYIRPASLYLLFIFIPAYFLFYLRWNELTKKNLVAGLILIIAYTGVLLPWCIRNEVQTGVFAFASTGPYVLFRQNATQFYEAYHHVSNLDARFALEDMAGIPHGVVPLEAQYSAVLEKVALQVIFEHPFRYALFHLTTFIPFFTSSGANDYWNFVQPMLPNFNPQPEPSLIQALNPFSLPLLLTVLGNHGWTLVENSFWGLVLILVLIGLWRSKDVRLMRLFFAVAVYFALVTGPISHARYRIPVEPLLLIGAFSAALYLYEKHGKNLHLRTRS